ncbi:neuropeptide CCHamide-1 receptor-like [Bacillus rossius redtenbacheri]|uniref:neuropeptide CCHamide-1 receptor-like n=1 Tax=Bacillus rossius redtenbacheri TaxID=93214 RepID=UPI002FDC7DA5
MVICVTFNILLLAAGVVLNGTLLLILVREKSMRTMPNAYIANLAIADLVLITTFLPLFTSDVYTQMWLFGNTLCKIVNFLNVSLFAVSVFTFTALSAERYYTTRHFLQRARPGAGASASDGQVTFVVIAVIWTAACALALPFGLNAREIDDSCVRVKYSEDGDSFTFCVILIELVALFAVPAALITVFHVLTSREISRSVANIPGERAGHRARIRQREKSALLLLALVLTFLVFNLPYYVHKVWILVYFRNYDDYTPADTEPWFFFAEIAMCVKHVHACVSPVVLYFMSDSFRKHFNRYLFCCCCGCCSCCTNKKATEAVSVRHISGTSGTNTQSTLTCLD